MHGQMYINNTITKTNTSMAYGLKSMFDLTKKPLYLVPQKCADPKLPPPS